jgi:hypothetical protein
VSCSRPTSVPFRPSRAAAAAAFSWPGGSFQPDFVENLARPPSQSASARDPITRLALVGGPLPSSGGLSDFVIRAARRAAAIKLRSLVGSRWRASAARLAPSGRWLAGQDGDCGQGANEKSRRRQIAGLAGERHAPEQMSSRAARARQVVDGGETRSPAGHLAKLNWSPASGTAPCCLRAQICK